MVRVRVRVRVRALGMCSRERTDCTDSRTSVKKYGMNNGGLRIGLLSRKDGAKKFVCSSADVEKATLQHTGSGGKNKSLRHPVFPGGHPSKY